VAWIGVLGAIVGALIGGLLTGVTAQLTADRQWRRETRGRALERLDESVVETHRAGVRLATALIRLFTKWGVVGARNAPGRPSGIGAGSMR
jgi:hypothetical protein